MRKPRCAGGKKLAVCLLALMLLTGCSRWKEEGRTVDASPSLELLSMPANEETARCGWMCGWTPRRSWAA